jgi:hypothetical protein
VIDERDVQLPNALSPIDVTVLGIGTDTREVQYSNAPTGIDVIPYGKDTEVNEVQLENILAPMKVAPRGMVIDVKDVQSEKALAPYDMGAPTGNTTDCKDVQEPNAKLYMFVTEDGTVTAVRSGHGLKAYPEIVTTVSGIVYSPAIVTGHLTNSVLSLLNKIPSTDT